MFSFVLFEFYPGRKNGRNQIYNYILSIKKENFPEPALPGTAFNFTAIK
jgi:hypothetical protein